MVIMMTMIVMVVVVNVMVDCGIYAIRILVSNISLRMMMVVVVMMMAIMTMMIMIVMVMGDCAIHSDCSLKHLIAGDKDYDDNDDPDCNKVGMGDCAIYVIHIVVSNI